ncbi:hypothetical protein FYC62_05015 [Pedobacter aquae]|uniref:Organic solvent tolerance-like N-terminal domain-containing protein n=1 Tax=Pedobacter aquae TaxID=2605747 RepID=A0A5C0VF49_9SPHI|nr:hypothetical protein [Pedobacter aquae]QEK51106.1 hypothetical protein FYC62_05015 [Pedobacter aquae]
MKTNYLITLGFSILLLNSVNAQSLIIPAKGKHIIKDKSIKELRLDSLVLNKKSSLEIQGKKDFTIYANHIILADKTFITALDDKNNGTNLILSGKFIKIGKTVVDVSGRTYEVGNKTEANGNGGKLTIVYDSDGLKPQHLDNKEKNYIETLAKGASTSTNPYVDVQNLWYRVALGSGIGRSPMGLPQGKVYDASEGKDGEVEIKPLNEN